MKFWKHKQLVDRDRARVLLSTFKIRQDGFREDLARCLTKNKSDR